MYTLNEIKLIFQGIKTWEDLGQLCVVIKELVDSQLMRKETYEYRIFYVMISQTASKLA